MADVPEIYLHGREMNVAIWLLAAERLENADALASLDLDRPPINVRHFVLSGWSALGIRSGDSTLIRTHSDQPFFGSGAEYDEFVEWAHSEPELQTNDSLNLKTSLINGFLEPVAPPELSPLIPACRARHPHQDVSNEEGLSAYSIVSIWLAQRAFDSMDEFVVTSGQGSANFVQVGVADPATVVLDSLYRLSANRTVETWDEPKANKSAFLLASALETIARYPRVIGEINDAIKVRAEQIDARGKTGIDEAIEAVYAPLVEDLPKWTRVMTTTEGMGWDWMIAAGAQVHAASPSVSRLGLKVLTSIAEGLATTSAIKGPFLDPKFDDPLGPLST